MFPLLLTFLIHSTQSSGPESASKSSASAPASSASPEQIAADLLRIRDFTRLLVTRKGSPHPDVSGDLPERDPHWDIRGTRGYRVGHLVVQIDPHSGLVVALNDFGPSHSIDRPGRQRTDRHGHPGSFSPPRRVSDEEARNLARRFFATTGRPYDLTFTPPLEGFNMGNLFMNFNLVDRGVPFDDVGGAIELDQETGQVDSFVLLREPPTPPANLVPKISADEAHFVALRAAASAGVPVVDFPEPVVTLCIATLDRTPDSRATYDFTPADRDDAASRRGRLVYDVRVRDAQYQTTLFIALVDALDERLLQVTKIPLRRRGAGSGVKPSPFAPSTEIRPWRVAEDGKPWSAPTFSTLKPIAADGFTPTRKILLTDGHLALPASYDPQSGLVGITAKGKGVATYRPSPALADLLRRKTKG